MTKAPKQSDSISPSSHHPSIVPHLGARPCKTLPCPGWNVSGLDLGQVTTTALSLLEWQPCHGWRVAFRHTSNCFKLCLSLFHSNIVVAFNFMMHSCFPRKRKCHLKVSRIGGGNIVQQLNDFPEYLRPWVWSQALQANKTKSKQKWKWPMFTALWLDHGYLS